MALDILHDNWGPYTHTEVENALKAYLAGLEDRINQAIQSGGVGLTDLSQEVQALLTKANTALQSETDPTVPNWAKQSNKPTYNVGEIIYSSNRPLSSKLEEMTAEILAAGATDSEMSDSSTKPVQNKVIKAYIDAVSQRLNTLIGSGNVQGAIDTFNEVAAFLAGINSSDTLAAKLAQLATDISEKADKVTTYTKGQTDEAIQQAVDGLGGGSVESVTVNGTKHVPDANGDVDLGNLRGQDGNSGVASADNFESVNNLNGGTTDTSSRVYVLGANQGKRLRDQIEYVYARLQAVYAALGNIAFWEGKTPIANILPDLNWGAAKHTITLSLSLTDAVVKHNGVAKSNGDTILVEEGGTLTLIVEPALGYALTSVTSSTTGATVSDNGNGTYSVSIVVGSSSMTLSITANADEMQHTITYNLTNCSATTKPTSVAQGGTATIVLQADPGLTMPLSLPSVSGASIVSYTIDANDDSKATLVIDNANGAVSIAVSVGAILFEKGKFFAVASGLYSFNTSASYSASANRACLCMLRSEIANPCTWKGSSQYEDTDAKLVYSSIPIPSKTTKISFKCAANYYYFAALMSASGDALNSPGWVVGSTKNEFDLANYPSATHLAVSFKIGNGGTTAFSNETYESMGIELTFE